MNLSIAILEFINIAEAYFILDKIIKTFTVDILKAQKICPGKFLTVFSGNTSEILDLVNKFGNISLQIKSSYVTGISNETLNAISRIKESKNIDNIGIIEVKNAVNSFIIADTLLKNFEIDILKLDFATGLFGKAVIFINGALSDITNAVNFSTDIVGSDKIINTQIISSPCDELKSLLS
ncbi:MAG: BMC domain-containing protein [Peptoanaerobacter stomatis]|uniref:BMC domain-containing protein n=1 Tax=Peptoanaerobacter stomatis TaxID=796937 RepID=UPI003F9FC4E5